MLLSGWSAADYIPRALFRLDERWNERSCTTAGGGASPLLRHFFLLSIHVQVTLTAASAHITHSVISGMGWFHTISFNLLSANYYLKPVNDFFFFNFSPQWGSVSHHFLFLSLKQMNRELNNLKMTTADWSLFEPQRKQRETKVWGRDREERRKRKKKNSSGSSFSAVFLAKQ